MADILWVKVLTNIRNNNKIKIIKAMPEGDALFAIWIDFICMAGETADGGYIYITEGQPYSDEELAIELNRTAPIVRLALQTFQHYNMITVDEKGIVLNSFSEIQDIESIERIREQRRIRVQRFREKRKVLALPEANVEQKVNTGSGTVTLPVTLRNGIEKRREENIREENDDLLKNLWDEVLKTLKTEMNPANYKLFEKDIFLVELTDSEITLGTKNEYQAGHVERQLKMRVEQAFINCGHALPVKIILIE